MLMNIIFSICLYPVILILWIVFKKSGKNTKRFVFGVKLTKEQKESDEVKRIHKEYDRNFWILLVATIWIPLLAFAFDKVSVQFTIWMVWFLAVLVIMMIPYGKANNQVKAYKGENVEEENLVQYIELRSVRTLKFSELVLPIVLSFLGPVYLLIAANVMNLEEYQRTNYLAEGGTYLVIAVLSIILALCAIWMDKGRTLVINGDSDVNMNYSRAVKKMWKNFWMFAVYTNAAVALFSSVASVFEFHSFMIFLCLTIAETVVFIIVAVYACMKKKAIEEAYESKFEIKLPTDQDNHWIWGMFYYNPHDKNTLVEKRFGIGMTTNMARKGGIISGIIGLLALIWIPFFCVYMIMEDYTPTHLIYRDNQVICRHLKDEYTIDVEDIISVEIVKELPEHRSKTFGTATDYYEKGVFRAKEGNFTEFVILSYDTFLKITTEDNVYYINGNSEEETCEIYNMIQ